MQERFASRAFQSRFTNRFENTVMQELADNDHEQEDIEPENDPESVSIGIVFSDEQEDIYDDIEPENIPLGPVSPPIDAELDDDGMLSLDADGGEPVEKATAANTEDLGSPSLTAPPTHAKRIPKRGTAFAEDGPVEPKATAANT